MQPHPGLLDFYCTKLISIVRSTSFTFFYFSLFFFNLKNILQFFFSKIVIIIITIIKCFKTVLYQMNLFNTNFITVVKICVNHSQKYASFEKLYPKLIRLESFN